MNIIAKKHIKHIKVRFEHRQFWILGLEMQFFFINIGNVYLFIYLFIFYQFNFY